jgi:hypothetical protein
MSLADLDRPPITWRFDRWDRDVTFRPLSARQLSALSIAHSQAEGEAIDTPAALQFYAGLLAACLVDPQFDAATWLDASTTTLQTLGMKALEINGLIAAEAKKN